MIVDTAGRLAVDEEMMDEISRVKEAVKPQEILFVVDAMTGQDAVNTAKTFNERLDFDGVVLTKLDGDTRGGAALTIRSVVHKPIKFVGTGETLDGIDTFHPDRMANRILGMGDIVSLVEKAQQQFDEKEAEEIAKKFRRNQFTFNDFIKQIQQVKKMGNIQDLAAMIPGVGKAIKDIDIDDNDLLTDDPDDDDDDAYVRRSEKKKKKVKEPRRRDELTDDMDDEEEGADIPDTGSRFGGMRRFISKLGRGIIGTPGPDDIDE